MATLATAPLRLAPRPSAADVALALVLGVSAQVELWVGGMQGPTGANVFGALMTTLPLAWRTLAPLPTAVVTTAAFSLSIALGVPADEPLVSRLAPLVALYSLGLRGSGRTIAAGAVATLALQLAAVLGQPGVDLALETGATLVAIAVGVAVREIGFETDVLEARTSQLERERDEKARAAVSEERARIARELHDLIGHSISVMGIQAGAVRRRLTAEQEQERAALLAVERVGRETVDEMRRLLGILRTEADAELGTLPPLGRLADLVADMRGAGLEADLSMSGSFDDLSAGRALAVFRIVQEALTNVLKHAPRARVRVAIERSAATVAIDVVDDGAGEVARPPGPDGHGIVGMRERVALYGGSLDARPRRDGGGFAVHATIPVAEP